MMLVINCKNYEEVSGAGLARLLGAAHAAAKKHKVSIAVAPPQHLLGSAAGGPVPVLAQHVDNSAPGGTTGFIVPELLKRAGVAGSLINHSEHRIPGSEIARLVPRLRKLEMISIVCAKDAAEAGRHAKLNPDYIAVEPPELIGSGRAVSRHRPEVISRAAAAVDRAGNSTRLLCGAGITSGADIARATELGAGGALVASGVIKSANWRRAISELASSMV